MHFIYETNEPMVIKYGTGIPYWKVSGKLNFVYIILKTPILTKL
jgi:hypothetical protein